MRYDFSKVMDLKELIFCSVLFTDADYSGVPCLFHYTNASNREYIIKDDYIDLRFTRADAFFDEKEGQHIINVYSDAVEQCLHNKQIDFAFSEVLLSVIRDFASLCNTIRKKYVFCFSKAEMNQYLIENYACRNKRAGMIIGFHSYKIEELTDIIYKDRYPVELYDVVYDGRYLSAYIQTLICRMYQLKEQDDAQMTLIKRVAMNQLAMYSLVYKSPVYAEEKESRMIVDYSLIDPNNSQVFLDSNHNYIHVLVENSFLYNTSEVMI